MKNLIKYTAGLPILAILSLMYLICLPILLFMDFGIFLITGEFGDTAILNLQCFIEIWRPIK